MSHPGPPARVADALADFARVVRARFGPRVRQLRLFGSFSRGEQRADSDVDVLVVVDGLSGRERRDVYDLGFAVFERHLVHVAPLALSTDEMDALRARERLIAREIDRDGVAL